MVVKSRPFRRARGAGSIPGFAGMRRPVLPVAAILPLIWIAGPPRVPLSSSHPDRSVRCFEEVEGRRMQYAWTNVRGERTSLAFFIPRQDLEASESGFGYFKTELEKDILELEAALRERKDLSPWAMAQRLLHGSPMSRRLEIREGPEGSLIFAVGPGQASDTEAAAETARLQARLDQDWLPCREAVRRAVRKRISSYLADRGLVRLAEGIAVRYDEVVERNLPFVRPLASNLEGCTRSQNTLDLLEAVLSFVQAIPNGDVPAEQGGKYTAGLSVPLRVLADDRGDCDSKAVLFACLWRSLSHAPLALVSIPDHMLVAVAVPRPAGAVISIHSRKYVLLEVCTGRRTAAGTIMPYSAKAVLAGRVRYKLID